MRVWLAVLVALAAGCDVPEGEQAFVRSLDYDEFVSDVQPVLAALCGNPSCHGRIERPFSMYSHGNWRADPDMLYQPVPLTVDELDHNFSTSVVLVSEATHPADALLVVKPLAEYAGTYHGGGPVFAGTTDRSYRVLLNWIEGGFNE